MKINLIQNIPITRRFFSLWVTLIALVLGSLSGLAVWGYLEQRVQLAQVNKRISVILPQEAKVRAKVKEKEEFTADHRAVLDYQKTVGQLKSENMDWDQALSIMESAMSAEGRLFNVQVKGQTLKGMAAFSTLDSISYFQSQMKKSSSIYNFAIDSVEEASAMKDVKIKPETAKVVRFHFTFKSLAPEEGGR
ncbi:hypothetical protein ACFO25_11960 [Paenactinomyces guangxiensis]|uniref:Uncharacterized protein n=1 Tax=Paenactinomyces guangxiensis TaxID=1490290 RepID=A0A7W1WU76_9BACL|nr:hypothetical protein [Paenactinomyces guangxiensis]MBA4496149.1 hypothetical protein [Paenactinomyces guangxiensis]MBH8593237.1 hypothetical protein [Paenactinomyces guangxiensis]